MVLLRSAIYATTAVLGPADAPRGRHARLARAHAAPAAPRRRPRRPRRACARSCSAAPAPRRALLERAARRRAAGRPDLRAHAGLLAGHGRRARRHRDLRLPAAGRRASRSPPTARSSCAAPVVAGGGTLRTGDLGRLDERGRLIVTGRALRADRQRRRERRARRGRGGARAAPGRRRGRRVRPRPTPSGARPSWPPSCRATARRWTPRSCARSAARGSRASRSRRRSSRSAALPRTASGKLRRGALR